MKSPESSDVAHQRIAYWKGQLSGAPLALEMPVDRPRPAIKKNVTSNVPFELPAVVGERLRAFCLRTVATPFVVLLAAYQCVLSRWSGQNDVLVRTTAPVLVRTILGSDVRFVDVVRHVADAVTPADSASESEVTVESLAETLGLVADASRPPIAQAMFAMTKSHDGIHASTFDLLLALEEDVETFRGSIEYDVALFDRATIERFATHFVTLLDAATQRPDERVAKLPLMMEAERSRVLVEWNATERSYEPGTAHELFEAQVRRTPDAPAIGMGAETLTYAELNRRANRIAHYLRAQDVQPGSRVALCANRSIETIAALLGILKSGAAYVPVDPSYPSERIELMLSDAKPSALVTEDSLLAEGLPRPASAPVVRLDGDREAIGRCSDEDLQLALPAGIGCYVIYTSGSTGRPKGVMMPHRPLVNLLWWQAESAVLRGGVTLQFTPLSFDVSFQELFSTWMHGGKLVLISEETRRDPSELLGLLEAERVERLFLPFVALKMLAQVAVSEGRYPRSLKCVVTAGEQLLITPEVAELFARLEGCVLHNHYGPSETHVVTAETLTGTSSDWAKLPSIGRAIANTTLYVLDDELQPVPIGVAGELYLGGACLADGYFDRPALTAERFVPSPFAASSGRMYKTGDLVRYLADGRLEYLGRADTQVKVRGFRVEPGEVETALASLAGVKDCAVTARKNANAETILVAYVVGGDARVDDLRASLKQRMPEYMVPTAFVVLDALPLTPSGKVDRKALPAPDFTSASSDYVAPRDATEEALAEIFREVLGVARVGVHDDFFALGGHSLLATRVVSRIRSAIGCELPVRGLFEDPTVARLAQRTRAASAAGTSAAPALVRVERGKPLPASFAQARLWFLDQLEGGASATYNVPEVFRLEGAVDADALEQALRELVGRHEALRTTFLEIDGDPHQVIHPTVDLSLRRIEAKSEDEARALVTREVRAPFDLAKGPLIRATLVRLRSELHIFVVGIHHIATDGWSNETLMRELSMLYAAIASGRSCPLAARAIDYADFAVWQRSWLDGEVLASQLAFWKDQLRGAPAALELPTDRPRPAVKQTIGATIDFELPKTVIERMRALCRREATTPFMLLLTAYQSVLSRWTGQKDIVVGTPIANRTRQELEGVVGFFVNTLAMRTRFDPNASFVDTLRQVKAAALSSYAHQDVPFQKLVEELRLTRDISRTPVFQAMFVLQNVPREPIAVGGVTLHREQSTLDVAMFDLTLVVDEGGEAFRCSLEYDVALFDRSTIERFADHFVTFLDAALGDSEARVVRLPLMGSAARDRVVVQWNATTLPFDETPAHRIFEAQAARTPNGVALVSGETALTYDDLNRRANALAAYLRRRGVGQEDRVATWLRRSPEMIVAELAVLKAGAAYVPVDPAYPLARVAYTIEDSGATLVLTTSDVASTDAPTEVVVLDAPATRHALTQESDGNLAVTCLRRQAAYVIYTSGTTGKPKGSVIEHRCLSNLVAHTVAMKGLGPEERHTQIFGPAFDATTSEIWPTLCSGATLCIVPDEIRRSPEDLVRWLRHSAISVSDMPTALAMAIFDEDWTGSRVRLLVLGGEALRRRPPPGAPRVLNVYGPTETTDHVTVDEVVSGSEPVTSIGRPIANVSILILDADGEPTPIGVYGEIHVGGASVGRGYLGRAALTAEKFVPDPFTSVAGARLYRTGDRGRWLVDGRIEFAGRNDDQIKIRGFRVELGEIETALAAVSGVEKAVVVAREDAPGDKRLVAYLVGDASVNVVTAQLRSSLPDYMIPSAFVVLESLPVTPNGKVDRKALPAPDITASAGEYVAPRDATEERLAGIFREVLGVARVGVMDDFFAVGGHSLLATRVISRLRSVLGIELPVRALFEAPTVARLATHVHAGAAVSGGSLIERVDRARPLPASFAQARLWFLDQLEGAASATYNVPEVVRVEGPVDGVVLERALQALVARHETLRTTFVAIDGEPHQVIDPAMELRLARIDAKSEDEARAIVSREVHAPFDLAHGPLLRGTLVRLADDAHLFVLNIHHIATDGWSNAILTRELWSAYAALSEGKAATRPAQALDYADFAVWQRSWLEGEALARQLAFWKEHLAGAPAALELPTDRPRPPSKQHVGASVDFELPALVTEAARALCRREGATPFMVLLAAYQCVLSRWSGQKDVVVGTPIANRTHHELEGMVGFFVNTLALRTTVAPNASFTDVLQQVKGAALSAYAHQDVPFEKLVEELKVPRDMSRTPIFQAAFVLQNTVGAQVEVPGLRLGEERHGLDVAKFDLTLEVVDDGDRLHGSFEYDVTLFDRATIARFAEHFRRLLESALARPDDRVMTLPLMTEAERQRVLFEWNATRRVDADDVLAHELIEAQARRTPDAIAVKDECSQLSYRELIERAERIAGWLAAHGASRDARVGVSVSRTVDMIPALVGVLKAGAAYVPIDPSYPSERRAFMQADAQCAAVLTDETLPEAIAWSGASAPLHVRPRADELAYVIYTSGSTGQPKGVMVEHRSLVNLVRSLSRAPAFSPEDRALVLTTLSFDVSGAEIYTPLAAGSTLVVATDQDARDPALLAALIERFEVTVAGATPATWRMMTGEGWRPPASVRIHTAGEALTRDLADRLIERGARLFNLYGPTETTIYSTGTEVRAAERITIGRPIDNTQMYVLDEHMAPAPIGVFGELFIAGDGVARGYVGRPGLTAEKFVPDPYAKWPGARMYRTGDVARWLADGTLEYVGRRDHQVKVRGFRIELGEIEATLQKATGVSGAVVVAREDVPGDKRIVAYVVGRAELDELRTHVSTTLPDYMVPNAFVMLDAFPLTASGKIDRKALPAPDFTASAAEYVAPRDATEELLAGVFRDVLAVPRVGVMDDFFALGGHSLLATRVVSRVRSACGVELPVRALFGDPTVARLAQRVRAAAGDGSTSRPLARVDRSKPVSASFAQSALWFLDQLQGASATFNLAEMIRLRGPVDAQLLERGLRALVQRHETLRTTFVALDGEPHQVIRASSELRLSLMEASSEQDALRILDREVDMPFDLAQGPLVRATLVRVSADVHFFALCIHHSATDGLSNGILIEELSALYSAFANGAPSPLRPQTIDYADFAAWQRSHLTGDVLASEVAFWRGELAGAPPSLEMPTDRSRPAVWSGRGASEPVHIDASLANRIESFARAHRTTTPAVLMAAYAALLSRYASQQDLTIGVVSAARTHPQTERMVGLFANLVPMRTRVEGDLSFGALVDRVRARLIAVLAHQEIPFDVVVSKLQIPRDLSRHPVFQAAFAFMAGTGAMRVGDAAVEHVQTGGTVAKSDIALDGSFSRDGGIDAELTYAVDLFAPQTITRLATWFVRLLDEGTRNPDRRISDIQLLRDDDEVKFPLVAPPEARDPWTTHITRHAEAHPEMVAVVDLDRVLTFRDLDEQSERLARALAARGVRRGDVVALTAERRLEWIVGMVAINKALATYMPLDPQLPERRMRSMLSRAGCRLIVTQTESDALGTLGVPVASFRTLLAEDVGGPRVHAVPHRRDAAYIIFTSGSTGEPKGVVIEHEPFAVLIENWVRTMRLKAGDRMLQMVSTSFDVAMGEVGATLRAGGTVVLRTDEMMGSIAGFVEALRTLRINVFHPSAPFLHALCSEVGQLEFPSCVHTIVPGGDQLSLPAMKDWFAALEDRVQVVNAYGPTEATVSCITNVLTADDESIDIGRPFPGSTAYVLDEQLRPVLPGAIGELWLSGAQLGRGYVSDPMQTAWRYVPDPFSDQLGARMYRTGDLARVVPNGKLTFIGRMDGQVKIRGYRIEIGEVVATLRSLHGVVDAVVTVREDVPGDKRLIAYVVGPAAEDDVRAAAREALPAYMMPAAIVKLDAFPLAATGKVDKRALPAPSHRTEYVAPRTPTERVVAESWRDVLRVEVVGANDNFFDLGGHSLLATRLVGRLKSRHGLDLSLTTLFKAPTVAEMAKALDEGVTGPSVSSLVTLRDGTTPTLVLVHAVGGSVLPYEPLVRALDAERRVVAFESRPVAADASAETLPSMAARYVAELLATGIAGPVVLIGWSMGGALAFEMAHELLACGADILRVVMLDTLRPSAHDRTATLDESKYVDAFAADLAGAAGISADIAFGLSSASVDERLRALAAAVARHGHPDLDEATLQARFRIFVRNAWAFENHDPRPLPRPVTLVRAAETLAESEPSFGWQGLASRLETSTVPGDHYSVVREPNIAAVAAIVNRGGTEP